MKADSCLPSVQAGGVLVACMLAIAQGHAATINSDSLRQTLRSVPNVELPATAANLVVKAQGADREQSTETIVGTAVSMNPVAAPLIVSSVARVSPDVAAITAVAAAAKEPKQVRAIAKAASTAAPSKATQIVSALCKAHPTEYAAIAGAVSESVPGQNRSIIAVVGEAVPSLKPFIARATDVLGADDSITVADRLTQMGRDLELSAQELKTPVTAIVTDGLNPAQLAALSPPPPMLRPPFQPLNGQPREIDRRKTREIKPGGPRNYSAP